MRFKIKLRKTDRLFTRLIRERDNYTCRRCGRVYPEDNCQNLGVSHFWGRGRENTRFDSENCDALCTLPCHAIWAEEDRKEYEAFKIRQLGQEGFDLLDVRAHTYKKRDDKMDEIILKEMLKELEKGTAICINGCTIIHMD